MNVFSFSGGLRRAFFSIIAAAVFVTSLVGRAGAAQPDQGPPFTSVCVIGDSLSDTGRTSAVLTQVIGQAFPPLPYAPGRMSNGPVWIEYFTPMLRQNYQPLDNFSWAGAGTGHDNVFGPALPGMLDQLGELRTPVTRRLNKNALYVVFGGANDFFRILQGADASLVIPAGVGNILQVVRSLREAGAEKIVVVDLPDIGMIPRVTVNGPIAAFGATYLSAKFNEMLNAELDALAFPVVRVSLFNLLHDFVANKAKYGFTNVSDAAVPFNVASAGSYLFWDDVHPTTLAHRFVAEEVYRAVLNAGWIKHPLK